MFKHYPEDIRPKITYLKVFGYKAYLLTNNVFIRRARNDFKVKARAYIRWFIRY